ncbi:MAG: hypothetical protein OEW48_09975 [Phycisphaerae bacterium]|nr:hypothetical protein [Phycisphaerae bacterium]
MNEILAQIMFLARRSRGTKDWGNILFIVFLAIFWAGSAILKLKAKKVEDEKTGVKQLRSKPGGKPAAGTTKVGPFQQIRRAIEAEVQKQRELQQQAQQARRKMVRPQPAVRKVSPQPERTARIPALEPVKETGLPILTAQVEPKIEILPELTDKTITKVSDKRRSVAGQLPRSRYLSGILSDYSDADELKRAILHYEILGRPLSLRDPSGHIIGL